MDNKQFTFRRRIESDFEILYKAYEEYTWSNIQPYFSGPCVVLDKAEFLEQFQKIPQDHRRPSVIVNADDTPCGVYRTTYQHANRYSEISIYMWRDTHLAKAVLKEVIDQTLGIGIPNHRVLVEIPGYAPGLSPA